MTTAQLDALLDAAGKQIAQSEELEGCTSVEELTAALDEMREMLAALEKARAALV